MYPLELSIIIINWKSKAFVGKCLESIRENAGALSHEVIVVDNASYDGCAEMIQSEFHDVIFIQSEQNLGFAGANNLAFAKCRGRNIMFLNPDTEIQGTAIQTLLTALKSIADAGMVGAHLLNSDLSLQTTCITALPSIPNQSLASNFLRRTFPKWSIWGMQPLFEVIKTPVPVEAISGACMLAKREVLDQVCCFSMDYFMYLEDMDLCLKVAKTGHRIYYVPEARIIHHAGGSSALRKESNFSSVVLRESLVRFFILHRGRPYAALYRAITVLMSLCRIGLLVIATPAVIRPGGYQFLSRAASKWSAILAWSLGLSRWENRQPLRPRSGI